MEQEQKAGETRKLELKICERCGGLWLRPWQSTWVYCRPCKSKVGELPIVRMKQSKKQSKPRLPNKGPTKADLASSGLASRGAGNQEPAQERVQ